MEKKSVKNKFGNERYLFSFPLTRIFSGDPISTSFLIYFWKVFIKENKEAHKLIQSMPDASQTAIFTRAESHLGKHLYSSPINRDPQKQNHVYFTFMSFIYVFKFFSLPSVSFFWVSSNNTPSVSPLQRQNFSLGKCNYSKSKLPDRHSLKLALQKSCHICVCGLSLECSK